MSKWTAIAIVGAVVIAMTFASFSGDVVEWDRAEKWLAQRQLEWRGDGAPVVASWPQEGCSRDHYSRAAELAAQLPDELGNQVERFADGDERLPEDRPEAELVSAPEVAAIVAELRAGVRKINDVDPGTPRLGPLAATGMVDALALRRAYAALRLTARQVGSTAAGEAIALLLDGLTAALDAASAGVGVERLIGQDAVVGFAAEFDDEWLRALDRPQLDELDRALADLIAVHPVGADFIERELAHRVACVANDQSFDPADLGLGGRWVAWRHGFSLRTYARSATHRQLELFEQCRRRAPAATASWPERRAALEALTEEYRSGDHRGFALPDCTSTEEYSRRAGVALRLLRLAVAFHREQPLPQLRDPLGNGMLQVEVDEDGRVARFYSADGLERAARR